MTSRAPDGLTWNGYRSWYSQHVGRASVSIVAQAYTSYPGKVSQRRSRSATPRRKASPSPKRRPKSAPSRKKPSPSPPRESPERRQPTPKKRTLKNGIASKSEIPLSTRHVSAAELCDRIQDYVGVRLDLSGLICSQLKTVEPSWLDVLDVLKACQPIGACDACTKVGYRMARSLIRLAATRVFAEPEQSIVELPVNSVDAYNPERRIGKFGLGFYSILYWLVGHPRRSLTLTSTYRHPAPKTGLCRYKVRLSEVGGALAFEFLEAGRVSSGRTGFDVHLDATHDLFDTVTMSAFLEQLARLEFVAGARLRIDAFGRKYDAGDLASTNHVRIVLSRKTVSNVDQATAVPLEVLLGGLFVPSISTKTIRLAGAQAGHEVLNSRIVVSQRGIGGSACRLLILVGTVAVVSLSIPYCRHVSYLLELPLTTRVPVSRDDVILTPETRRLMLEGLETLFAEDVRLHHDVSVLQDILDRYIAYSANPENQAVVREAMEVFYEANKQRLVPSAYHHIYAGRDWEELVFSERYDVADVERWLDGHTRPLDAIWYGLKVLVLDNVAYRGQNVSDGGLVSYLFIDRAYLQGLGASWVQTITSSYFATKLYPVDSAYGAAEYARYDERRRGFGYIVHGADSDSLRLSDVVKDRASLHLLYGVLLKVDALRSYFEPSTVESVVRQLSVSLADVYVNLRDAFSHVCALLLRKFASFAGNQTYGGTRYDLDVRFREPIELELDIVGPARQKASRYFAEHVGYVIQAIKEQAITTISLYDANSPRRLRDLFEDVSDRRIFFAEAVMQSSSFAELTVLCSGVGRAFLEARQQYVPGSAWAAIGGLVSHVLASVRSQRYTPANMVTLYEYWAGNGFLVAGYTFATLTKDQLFGREWLRSLSKVEGLPLKVEPLAANRPVARFKLSKELRYLFAHDLPARNGLKTFFEAVQDEEEVETTPLQVIEIAVNEGTVKPFVEATLTELVQNSIDAIREFRPTETGIDVYLARLKDDVGLVLNITDQVGMSADAFVYVGIPFLSTKSPSELVTGEIGSGFFNAYRESSSVHVKSVRDRVSRVVHDVPVRDGSGRVVDVEKEVQRLSKTTRANYTTIQVTIPTQSRLDFVNAASRVEYTLTRVLSLALTPSVKYQGASVTLERVLMVKVGYFELYATRQDGEHGLTHESYLLTKGVPFAPLPPYVKERLLAASYGFHNENLVVNITHGGYTPVQTRTKVRLAPEAQEEFELVALYLGFLGVLRRVAGGQNTSLLDHIDSKQDAEQLRFTMYPALRTPRGSRESNLLKYTSFEGQPTLIELLNACIDVLNGRSYEEAKADIEAALENRFKTAYPKTDELVREVARIWLRPKNTAPHLTAAKEAREPRTSRVRRRRHTGPSTTRP